MPTSTTKSHSGGGSSMPATLDLNNAPDWLERLANGLDGAPRMMAAAFHTLAPQQQGNSEHDQFLQISDRAARDITAYLRTLAATIRSQPAQTAKGAGGGGR